MVSIGNSPRDVAQKRVFGRNNETCDIAFSFLHWVLGKSLKLFWRIEIHEQTQHSPPRVTLFVKQETTKCRFVLNVTALMHCSRCQDKICTWLSVGQSPSQPLLGSSRNARREALRDGTCNVCEGARLGAGCFKPEDHTRLRMFYPRCRSLWSSWNPLRTTIAARYQRRCSGVS